MCNNKQILRHIWIFLMIILLEIPCNKILNNTTPIFFLQVMPSQITNPGDAEEKRYSCHRVDRVTLDSAHHRLAPKRYNSTPRHPQGYALLCTPLVTSSLKWVLEPNTTLQAQTTGRSFRGTQ